MRVLIACEFSGTVRDAFIDRGHEAMSCDILPAETPGPHYLGDGWDLMIAHPPCTYLSRAGARWLYPVAGQIDPARLEKGRQARAFFMDLYHAPIQRVAIENPTPFKVFELPAPSQVIQPYEYGHPFSKRTLLWLRGLEPLTPTDVRSDFRPLLPSNTGGAKRGQRATDGARAGATRRRTFVGIAAAMAEQWGRACGPFAS